MAIRCHVIRIKDTPRGPVPEHLIYTPTELAAVIEGDIAVLRDAHRVLLGARPGLAAAPLTRNGMPCQVVQED